MAKATAFFLLSLTACGTVHPQIDVRPTVLLAGQSARGIRDVALRMTDDAALPVFNRQADAAQYETLAQVRVALPSPSSLKVRNLFWYNDFESHDRFVYCVWQTPLRVVTLSLWNLVPLAWGCFAANPSDPLERLDFLSKYARRVAAAMGGDAVLLRNTQDSTETHIQANTTRPRGLPMTMTSAETTVEVQMNTGATFEVLRRRAAAPPTAQPEVPATPFPAQ